MPGANNIAQHNEDIKAAEEKPCTAETEGQTAKAQEAEREAQPLQGITVDGFDRSLTHEVRLPFAKSFFPRDVMPSGYIVTFDADGKHVLTDSGRVEENGEYFEAVMLNDPPKMVHRSTYPPPCAFL